MKLEDIDSLNNNPYPKLAEAFYNIYNFDAIEFLVDVANKAITFSNELFAEATERERRKMQQILELEIIAKFCHYAESLAAISIAFSDTFDSEQDEWIGTYNTIAKYTVAQCLSFYRNIGTRDEKYVAKLMGYPPLDLQDSKTKAELEILSNSCKEVINEIGQYYLTLFEIYDAYKHSYRILFGTVDDTGDHAFAYFDNDAKQKQLTMTQQDFQELTNLASSCRLAIETIFNNHKVRIEYEKSGQVRQQLNLSRIRKKDAPPLPERSDRVLRFASRGQCAAREKAESLVIYEQFKDDLEKNHKGKYVAIDLDSRNVLGYDYNIGVLMDLVRQSGSGSRIHIRRIGKDDRVNIDHY